MKVKNIEQIVAFELIKVKIKELQYTINMYEESKQMQIEDNKKDFQEEEEELSVVVLRIQSVIEKIDSKWKRMDRQLFRHNVKRMDKEVKNHVEHMLKHENKHEIEASKDYSSDEEIKTMFVKEDQEQEQQLPSPISSPLRQKSKDKLRKKWINRIPSMPILPKLPVISSAFRFSPNSTKKARVASDDSTDTDKS